MKYLMVKNESEQRRLLKGCYGTNEWSNNSGICCNCKWKEDCYKVNRTNKVK